MVDHVAKEKRSEIMRSVGTMNTGPEMQVRSAAHRLGLRFRLYRKDLPGTPDLVFPKHRIALFVHGCFWHRHPGCTKATLPKSNVAFWTEKFRRNVARDDENLRELTRQGWQVVVVWQCEAKTLKNSLEVLESRLFPLLRKAESPRKTGAASSSKSENVAT